MMILISILILAVFAVFIFGLQYTAVRPGYLWFGAIVAAVSAFVLILLSFPENNLKMKLLAWENVYSPVDSPAILVDQISWPLAVALLALLIVVLLMEIVNNLVIDAGIWGATLAAGAFGLFSVLAANPLTLLLAWAGIDLLEMLTLLRKSPRAEQRERIVLLFALRVLGMFFLVAALLRSQIMGLTFRFERIPIEISGYLILAAGVRLGVLVPHPPFFDEPPVRRGFGTLIRFLPVFPSLMLVNRVAVVGLAAVWQTPILILSGLALFFGSLAWLSAKNELNGRPYWILTLSALGIIAAAQAQFAASQVWSISLILAGGVVFFAVAQAKSLFWLPVLGFIGVSGLPFTPVWHGLDLYLGKPALGIVVLLAHSLLLWGYGRHARGKWETGENLERLGWVIYPFSLGLLIVIHFFLTWVVVGFSTPSVSAFIAWGEGILILGLLAVGWFASRADLPVFNGLGRLQNIPLPLNGVYRLVSAVFYLILRIANYVSVILEGQGGILWAVLLLILLITLYAQQGNWAP